MTQFGGQAVHTTASTVAGAYGPAIGAKTFSWDGAATPTLTVGGGDIVISGQGMAGFAGIPEALLDAASTGAGGAGKNTYRAISPE